jgi:hypothetical protein
MRSHMVVLSQLSLVYGSPDMEAVHLPSVLILVRNADCRKWACL